MDDDLPYRAEYAKSNRSKCQSCKQVINKMSLRLAVVVQNPVHDGKMSRWYHFDCFFLKQRPESTADIGCFDEIRNEDQEKIQKKIEECLSASLAKPSVGGFGDFRVECYGSGDELSGIKELSKKDRENLKTILPKVSQADIPPPSKKMKKEPEDAKEAELIKKQNEELYNIKDQVSKLGNKDLITILQKNNQKNPKGKSNILNLIADVMYFGALKPCPKCKGQLIYNSGLGYKCTGYITKWAKCDYISQDPKRKKCKIPSEMKKDFPVRSYKSKVRKRLFKITTPNVIAKKSKSRYEKSSSDKMKVKVKSGGAVDPDSGLDYCTHIYQKGKDKYTETLIFTDIQLKKNSFYKLQILKNDKYDKYYLFRSWGRIGTTIGGNMVKKLVLEECIEQFESLYEKKSGNKWKNREHFVKVPGLKYPIDIDYGEEEIALLDLDIKSNLQKPIQDLIRLIFNKAEMKKVMLEFEIDMDKMPLGKLSKKQIYEAYAVLKELEEILKKSSVDRTTLIDASNRFYTLIPHNFGISEPKILETTEEIKNKCDMLNALFEMKTAYKLLHDKTDEKENPLDYHYKQLKTDIEVLDKESDEFKMIEQYVKNTHAATHRQYNLEIEEVFVVKRQGEEQRFEPFKELPNRKLLWHGSRTSNFAGILSQGLRIAPPEVPATGYMFGKGIYFADMVSKSANYCWKHSQNSTGLLLLCEVALGNMYVKYEGEYIKKLPEDKHSTMGRGQTQPNPQNVYKMKDGVEVPYGEKVPVNLWPIKPKLLYNEYIVYDEAQVKVRYLLKMNFTEI